ncbi:MAG: hypothetical protein KC505_01045 [Myxococcales bacterium]|nr:hypothetical protein [Myxococcales bacterium]USN49908.1 MAG: hypothetical protein H6731_06405 [Myxococcales bacterium]
MKKFGGFENQLDVLDIFCFEVKVDSDLSDEKKIKIFAKMLSRLSEVPLNRSFQSLK